MRVVEFPLVVLPAVGAGGHSHTDSRWDGLPGILPLCTPRPGHQELPGRIQTRGQNLRLWHVQGHLHVRLLQSKAGLQLKTTLPVQKSPLPSGHNSTC